MGGGVCEGSGQRKESQANRPKEGRSRGTPWPPRELRRRFGCSGSCSGNWGPLSIPIPPLQASSRPAPVSLAPPMLTPRGGAGSLGHPIDWNEPPSQMPGKQGVNIDPNSPGARELVGGGGASDGSRGGGGGGWEIPCRPFTSLMRSTYSSCPSPRSATNLWGRPAPPAPRPG